MLKLAILPFLAKVLIIHFKTKWKNIRFNILLHFGGSAQVEADCVSFYLAFVCLCYISCVLSVTNAGNLVVLSCICKYANERTEMVICLSEKGSVLKIILFIKI